VKVMVVVVMVMMVRAIFRFQIEISST